MHLVNWNTIRVPKSHGGLGIMDPSLSNIALGEKILWRLVTGRQAWWKKVIVHKYLGGDRLRGVDSPPPHSELMIHYLETFKSLPSTFSKKGYLDPW